MTQKRGAEPRLHHYVPRFVLRRFANDKGQLKTLDAETGRTFWQPLAQAAARRDYNARQGGDGGRDQEIEVTLGKMESYLAPVIDMLIEGQLSYPVSAPPAMRQVIASQVLLQWARTPIGRGALSTDVDTKLKGEIVAVGREGLREMWGAPDDGEFDPSWDLLSDERAYQFIDYVGNTIRATFQDWRARQQELARRQMIIIRWTRKAIGVGDHPVLTWPDSPENFEQLGRIDPIDSDIVMMPLSRRAALLIAPHDAPADIIELPGTAAHANMLNEATRFMAERYVFSHPDDTFLDAPADLTRLGATLTIPLEGLHRNSPGSR